MKKIYAAIKATWLFLIFLLIGNFSHAQSDACSGATSLGTPGSSCVTTSYTVPQTFTNSATEAPAPCTGTSYRDGWYTFTTDAATTNVTVTGTSDRVLGLGVYSGACNAFTQVACIVPGAAGATLTATVSPSTTYYLRIMRTNNANANSMVGSICVYKTPVAPANDNCASAIGLTVNPSTTCSTSTSGTTVGATQSITALLCNAFTGNANDDVWYSFTATSTTHTVTVVGGTGFDAVVDVRSGACNGTTIGCADATLSAGTETVTVGGLTTGLVYYVRIYGYGAAGTEGTFTVCITTPAAGPINDNCGGVVALTVNPTLTCTTSTAGTSTSATQSLSGCSGTADDDVWYSITATAASHIITVTPGTMTNVVFELFYGSCGSLTSFGCINSTSGAAAEAATLTGLVAGTTYYIRVYSNASGSGQGTFTICATTVVPPVNDNCPGAVDLTVNSTTACTISTSGTTVGASQSQAGCAGTADDDVWYTFTATSTTHTVTMNSSVFDGVMQVFSGTCGGTLTSLGCIDNTIGTGTETTTLTGLTVGVVYYVRVYSYYNGVGYQGAFSICVTTPVVPLNDNCSGAVALTPASSCSPTSGTTSGATQSQAGCAGTADDDVWYSFTAASATQTITVTPGTLYDAVFQVFSGSCGTLASLSCVDNTVGANIETSTLTGLTIGVTYYIRIYSYYGVTTDQGTFAVCVTTPTPTSDNCGTAAALTVNPSTSCSTSTSGTTIGATQSQVGCVGNADDDVWYTFTALGASHTITVTPGTMNNAVFEVFSGTCGGTLVSMACINATTGASTETTTLTGLSTGALYYVRIYSNGAAAQAGTFTICITTPCTTGPGTGTTSLGCPSVTSGGLGLSGADPSPIDCLSSGCVNLEATYLQLGQTTSYAVESIPFAPPYQFGCLTNPVSVNIDDVWSPTINLPFNFCFYGNSYNKCLMSSNGVITFDTTTYTAGGGSTWQILNNLPNTALFKNSIFGVYHDIDPSIGGKVGWELITLNTGCRALVASWQGIPMYDDIFTTYDCNTLPYTGMIVLYENTNIIDVYIEEKKVCSDWNGGNAIVGIQDGTATTATVAPGRNGLDADWAVTNEAWRFIPNGPSITSIKWYEGVGTTGPVVGTTDTVNVCPTTTTTYTAEVTYALCGGATLKESETTTVTVDGNKVWNGSAGTNWNADANWTPPLVPTSADCVVIPNVTNDPIISGTGYDAFGYSLRVLPGGLLTLNSGNNLTVTNVVTVNPGANFNIKNSGSLVQIDNVPDFGSINMERITAPVYRFDYTYWNSPVTLASNYTLGMLSQNLTQPDKYYSWTPSQGSNTGIWAQESAATIMNPTKGYIVRAPNSFSFTPTAFTPYTANFIGTPNNGDIACPITFGTLGASSLDDKWNLIGNPYPSAVSALSFLSDSNNALVVDGTIYFWTHNSAINAGFADPFYGDYVLNYTASDYASWNNTGGVAATSGGVTPTGYIAAGQSFFVQSKAISGSAIFKNTMRVGNNNSQFFRPGGPEKSTFNNNGEESLERHRIWLNLTNNINAFNQLLVGYVQNATMEWDRGFDGLIMTGSAINFYSLITEKKLVIQGRPLPFNVEDKVPLGYSTTIAGNFSIRIDHFDGLFGNQNIYIEDKLLNVIHNLKQNPYAFTTQTGIFDDRFVLRYTDAALGTQNPDAIVGMIVFIKNKKIFAQASENIESIQVYDVTGKLIKTYKPSQDMTFEDDFIFAQGVYLAKIKLASGVTASRKLMN